MVGEGRRFNEGDLFFTSVMGRIEPLTGTESMAEGLLPEMAARAERARAMEEARSLP